MKFGPVALNKLPNQDPQKVLLHAERWQRALWAQEAWATPAKECYDFLEGRHYTATQLAKLKAEGRPHFKFNIIAPIVRLILGYQGNNRTDITHKPGQDNRSTDSVADALSKLEKAVADGSMLDFVDVEVFLDGLATGRGWYDTRLDFEKNDLGEIKTTASDPFCIYPDPDADTYDLNESAGYIIESKMVSIDEIEAGLGKRVADLIRPFTMGQTPVSPISGHAFVNDEISPSRYFGQREDATTFWDNFYGAMGYFVDTHRKTIRLIECQHKVREPRNVIIDLETGDKEVVPESWDKDRIQKALLWGEQMKNPLRVERRMVERIQFTTIAGDINLYDAPSYYDAFTKTGYFPYFRRGVTRGMVEDLIDPNKEKNKSRNARIEIEAKTANGGWMWEEESLDPVQERNLKKFGSMPGVTVKHRKGTPAPTQIGASQPSIAYEKLERAADDDVRRISGVNESALGEVDASGASGRATLARQRQAVVSVQMYMNNLRRSKMLLGHRHLYIFQNYYTEARIYRITGDDGKDDQVAINQMLSDPTSGGKRIINDITLGKYATKVDEQPLSATFANAQFEEMMQLLEKIGPVLGNQLPQFADLIIGMSSMPRKDEWIERLQKLQQPQGPPPPKPPSESINFKDLPPDGQAQLAEKAGIHLNPAAIAALPAPNGAPAPAPSGGHMAPSPSGMHGGNPSLTPAEAALPGGMH